MLCPCSSQLEKSLADFSCSEVVIEEVVVVVVKVIVVIVLLMLWLFLSHVRCSSDRRESMSFQNLYTYTTIVLILSKMTTVKDV